MSRTPAHAGGAGTPNPARPPASRPAAAHATPKPATTPASSTKPPAAPAPTVVPPARRNLIIGGSVAGALLLLVALLVWKPWVPSAPRLNEPIPVIAKFAASSGLGRLSFEQQRQYMELLDKKDEGVEEAYDQGVLGDQEFRRALQLAWYGEHLAKMDNFYSKPPTLRALYLDKQIDKKIRKKQKRKAEPGSDAKSALTADDIDRDDSTEERDIQEWPSEVRQRWSEYRAAVANRKQFWKDYREQNKGAKNGDAKGAAGQGEAQQDGASKTPGSVGPASNPAPR